MIGFPQGPPTAKSGKAYPAETFFAEIFFYAVFILFIILS